LKRQNESMAIRKLTETVSVFFGRRDAARITP
jgi:hypothetical protein